MNHPDGFTANSDLGPSCPKCGSYRAAGHKGGCVTFGMTQAALTVLRRHQDKLVGDLSVGTVGEAVEAALREQAAQLKAQRDELSRLLDALLNDSDCAGGAELDTNGIARVYVKVAALDAARAALRLTK